MYTLFMKNKKRVQTSFISNASSPMRSESGRKNYALSKSAIFENSDVIDDPNFVAGFGGDTSFDSPSVVFPGKKRPLGSSTRRLKLTKSSMSDYRVGHSGVTGTHRKLSRGSDDFIRHSMATAGGADDRDNDSFSSNSSSDDTNYFDQLDAI